MKIGKFGEPNFLLQEAQIAEGIIFKSTFLHIYIEFLISKADRQLRTEKLVWKNGFFIH